MGVFFNPFPQFWVLQYVAGAIFYAIGIQNAAGHVGKPAHGCLGDPFHVNEHAMAFHICVNLLSKGCRSVSLVLWFEVVVGAFVGGFAEAPEEGISWT